MNNKSINNIVTCIINENAINSFRSYFLIFLTDKLLLWSNIPTLASIYRMVVVISITRMEFPLLSV